jgi:hypothetical protein
VVEQSAAAEDRQHAFTDAIDLLEMWIAREDELVDPERVIGGDPVCDLFVTSDERRSGTAPDKTDSSPQVRADHEVVGSSAVKRPHSPLAL